MSSVMMSVRLRCRGVPARTHLDALAGNPRIRPGTQTRELVEGERLVAVADDPVAPSGAVTARENPQNRSSAPSPKGEGTINESRDGNRKQNHKDDENNHSE